MAINVDERIIVILKKRNGIATTTQILEEIYEEVRSINKRIGDELIDKKTKKELKREKERYQRRLLYHLNKLEKEGIIRKIGEKENGEKIFELREKHGAIPQTPQNRHIIIPIKNYEEKEIVQIYSPEDWNQRVNSLLIDATRIEKNEKDKIIRILIPTINDAIGIHHGEELFKELKPEDIRKEIDNLVEEALIYGRKISIELDPRQLGIEQFRAIVEALTARDTTSLEIILDIEKTRLEDYKEYIDEWIKTARGKSPRLNIYFSNEERYPIILGNAGVYASRKEVKEPILILGGVSIMIDMGKLSTYTNQYNLFREIVDKTVRSLVKATLKLGELYSGYYDLPFISRIIEDTNITRMMDHYIRIWNYDWRELRDNYLLELINTTIKETRSFARSQEIVLTAAGIPQRVGVAFNSAFSTFRRDKKASKRRYPKKTIFGIKDIINEEIREMLAVREELSRIYGMPDRVRVFRGGMPTGEEVYREITYLANTTNLRLLTIDLGRRGGDLNLKQFIK